MDFPQIIDFIKNYGFPIVIAVWAIWRLDKTWGSGESIHSSLKSMEDDIAEVKEIVKKNVDIQHELVTTMKIIQTIIGGEVRK